MSPLYSFTPDSNKGIAIERIVQKGSILPSHYVVNHQSGQVYSAPSGLLANLGFSLLTLSENWQEKIDQRPIEKDLASHSTMKKDSSYEESATAITGNSIFSNWNDPVVKMKTALIKTARRWGTSLTSIHLIDSQVSPYQKVSMAKEVQIKAQLVNRSNAARQYLKSTTWRLLQAIDQHCLGEQAWTHKRPQH